MHGRHAVRYTGTVLFVLIHEGNGLHVNADEGDGKAVTMMMR